MLSVIALCFVFAWPSWRLLFLLTGGIFAVSVGLLPQFNYNLGALSAEVIGNALIICGLHAVVMLAVDALIVVLKKDPRKKRAERAQAANAAPSA